jgi:hypothetical protein
LAERNGKRQFKLERGKMRKVQKLEKAGEMGKYIKWAGEAKRKGKR